jgi:cellulose synthase (UDP-forming)
MLGLIPAWVPAAITVLMYTCLAPTLSMKRPVIRAVFAAFAIVIAIRYAYWRTVDTMMPTAFGPSDNTIWSWLFYLTEMMLLVEGLVYLLMMSRRRDRHVEADDNERWYATQSAAQLPSVDVLIPTYNEGWDVLQKTLVGALALDYPNVYVHVLDDGSRDWLKEECESLGVSYIRRPDRAHAKAGNINYALTVTHADLVLVFDADFVAQRNFLKRTVGFFRDKRVGLVQVPHHFFNSDPVHANLGVFQNSATDQEFFFTDIMASRDAWGVAFSCGSNSLARRSALTQIHGIPTHSITEDILTSIVLLQHGWQTVFLNERLARGLAPEGLSAMYTQRTRWARGGIQLLFLRNGPLMAKGLTPIQRLFFLPLSWIATNIGLPIMILGPVLFLWFGVVAVPRATGDELLYYQVPMLLAMLGASRCLTTVKRNSIMALAQSVFASYRLLPTVLHSLAFPFAVGFKVTPKGKLAQGMQADGRAIVLSLGTIVALVSGIVMNNMPDFERVPPDAFLTPSLFWGSLTVIIMFGCLLMSFEFDRRRSEERFAIYEQHRALSQGSSHVVDVIDVSVTGAALKWGVTRPTIGEQITLELSDVGALSCTVERYIGDVGIGVSFHDLSRPMEMILVAKIFTHAYENLGKSTLIRKSRQGIWNRVVGGAHQHIAPAWSMLTGVDDAERNLLGLRPDLQCTPSAAYPRLMPLSPRAPLVLLKSA